MAKKSFLDELIDESMDLGEKVILGNLQNKCKTAMDKGAAYKREDNPFYGMGFIAGEFAEKMDKDLNQDPSAVYDQLNGEHSTPSEKVEYATYLNAYIRDCGREYSKLDATKGEKEYNDAVKMISQFGQKYGITKPIDKPGQSLKSGMLAAEHVEAVNSVPVMFSIKYPAKSKKREDLLMRGIDETEKFAKGKVRQYHKDAIENGKVIDKDPYFNKNNKEFGKIREKYALGKAMNSFVDLNDEKSAADKGLSNTRLSFGRKGSDQFQDMKDEYAQFKLALDNLRKDPSENNYMKLDERMAKLNEKVDAYLNYKNDQMDKKEIKSKTEKGPDGKDRKVPTNSNTRKRMDFAEALKQQMKDMKDAVKEVRGMYHEPVQKEASMDIAKEAVKDVQKEAVKEAVKEEKHKSKEKKYAKDDAHVQKMSLKDFDKSANNDIVRRRRNSVSYSNEQSKKMKTPVLGR